MESWPLQIFPVSLSIQQLAIEYFQQKIELCRIRQVDIDASIIVNVSKVRSNILKFEARYTFLYFSVYFGSY